MDDEDEIEDLEGGMWGIEEEFLDEADNDIEFIDVTDQFGDDDDINTIDPTTGINEEVMMINSGDLDFDRSDAGLYSGKTEYINERPLQQKIINTKFGKIICSGNCLSCPYIAICTQAVDGYISGLADFSATKKPRCKKGYKLMKSRKTGKLKCVRAKTTTKKKKKKSKSIFAPFMIFPKSKKNPYQRAGASIGNFAFTVVVLAGLAWAATKLMPVAQKGVNYGLESWKKVREIKLIGKR